jgi:hypothetical protein
MLGRVKADVIIAKISVKNQFICHGTDQGQTRVRPQDIR